MSTVINKGEWEGRTRGGTVRQNILFKLLKKIDVRWLYPLMWSMIPAYMTFTPKAVIASFSFYHKRLHRNLLASAYCCMANFITFGKVILDKFAMYAGHTEQYDVIVENQHLFTEHLTHDNGFLVVGAHVGNFELAGSTLKQDRKKFNLIFWGGEKSQITDRRINAFKKVNPDAEIISIGDDFSYIFEMKNVIDNGEVLISAADRICGSSKSVEVDFFGSKASFPLGLFIMAATLNVPVLAVFLFKGKGRKYHGIVSEIERPLGPSSKAAIKMANEYAKKLEDVVRQHPLQWFNFYNFWK